MQWGDVDLDRGRFHVQRSRHLYGEGATKTASADRWVELFPETIRVLRATQPLRVDPEMPVFTTTEGKPIEPKAFASRFWYRCLRALKLRVRGIYCTKDTFVTTALGVGVRIAWLEQQTGVNYLTLRKHYGKWMPSEGASELARFAEVDATLFDGAEADEIAPHETHSEGQFPQPRESSAAAECEEGDLNPHGCLAH